MGKISIVIIEDHEMVRQMWRELFLTRPLIEVAGEAASFTEAVNLFTALSPDIALLDINLPDTSGLEAIEELKHRSSSTRIIAVSMHSQPAYAKRMLELGAHGYVTKDSPAEEIFAAIEQAMNGQYYVCREIREHRAWKG